MADSSMWLRRGLGSGARSARARGSVGQHRPESGGGGARHA
jgi:hypothetical protein